MICYNWKNILKESKGDINRILRIIKAIIEHNRTGEILVQRKYPRYILNCLYFMKNRNSFLLNPEELLDNTRSYTNSELFIYLELAAKRNFMDFHLRQEKGIPIYYIEDEYDLTKLKMNSLLDVTDKVVRLKYEEENYG